jgi:MATE family multidrug resistance protein
MWMGLIAGLSMAALLLTLRFWRLAREPTVLRGA